MHPTAARARWPRPRPSAWRAARLGALLALALAAGACDDSGKRMPGESVFEFLSPPTPAEAVAWAADPYDADKRFRGLLLLANAPFGGEGPYTEMYRRAADDGDPGVRAMALRALAMHGTAADAAAVTKKLSDENELVRWEAARALQRMYDPESAPALLERLDLRKESNVQVRSAAAWALGQYAQPRVVQGLIGALRDRQLVVNESALASLRTLTGKDFGLDAPAWRAWIASSADPFAGRGVYAYPYFERDRTIVEWIIPFFQPPNETPGPVIGAPAAQASTTSSPPGAEEPAAARGG